MDPTIRIGLIGDFNPNVIAHQAIPLALDLAGKSLHVRVQFNWLPTIDILDASVLKDFDGLWCVPASPYQNMDGALLAIRHAREHDVPFLGTCGGFQHAVLEYARNVLGWENADHAETSPESLHAVIAPLACSLVEVTDTITLSEPSLIAAAYQHREIAEGYHCSYGLNPIFESEITNGPLRIVARNSLGTVSALELDNHRFFVTTLFQPERAALEGRIPPLVAAFTRAVADTV